MADRRSDGDRQEPTLELPKLFGRKRKPAPAPPEETVSTAPEESTTSTTEGARRAQRSGPPLPARLATVLTGLLVGALGTLLTFGAIRGCEAVTGTGACGEGPGLLLLAAIFVVMVLIGGLLLKVWGVSDPQSTSFLAVGATAVVVMLVLLEAVFSVWMFVVVPLVSMAAYALAHWVTHRFVDMPDNGPGVDVQ